MSFLNPQIPTIGSVLADTSPQLGGSLDVNGYGIYGPEGVGAGAGGNMLIYGGNGGLTGSGGYIYLTAGSAGSSGDGAGGTSYNYSGTGRGTGNGGQMLIQSGRGFNTGNGGPVNVYGGYGGGGGGPITIKGGAAYSSQNVSAGGGGDVTIVGGAAARNGAGGDIIITPGSADVATAGIQRVNTTSTTVGGSPTGLANDATVYTAAIIVDGGGSQPISVVGSAAQTFTDLINELNADTTGATWSLMWFDLIVTSDTTGASSTVAITDTDLFSSLTSFNTIEAAVPGTVPGSPGAINITQTTAPTVTTDKLYNVGGDLTWNGTVISDTVHKFAGNNTTTNVTESFAHNLGTTDVIVQVYDLTASPKAVLIPNNIAATDANNVTITLSIAPGAADEYRVVVTG